jgi:uncharacterized protein (TIGR03083 family)
VDLNPLDKDDLAAYVLDALDTDELKSFDARLDDGGGPGGAAPASIVAAWREALGDLGRAVAERPPVDLGAGALVLARTRRTPGASLHDTPDVGPADAYVRTVELLDELLGSLSPADWKAPTIEAWTVKNLVTHVIAVEDYFGRQLGLWPLDVDPALEPDHLDLTRAFVAAWADRPPTEVLATWRERARRITAHVLTLARDALRQPFHFHFLDTSLGTILIARVFELWTHDEDIRRATGRPIDRPDPSRLRRMSRVAVPSMPYGLASSGASVAGRTARIVLTGPGGGTWDQPLALGETAGEPDTTLVLDVVDYCRVAARRLAPEEVEVEIDGDVELARQVLAGAGVFSA